MTRRQRAHKRVLEKLRARLRLALATWPILAAIAITATSALASRPVYSGIDKPSAVNASVYAAEPQPVCWFTPFIGCEPGLDAGAAGE